jgi:copper(I)-binding protein
MENEMKRLMAVLGFMFFAAQAQAADVQVGNLTVTQPWSRATASSGQTGAIYLDIENHGTGPDRLTGAQTPVASMAHFHATVMDGDMASMKMMDGVDLPAGQTVSLKPQSMHLMLMGLKQPLKKGESFPLTLQFEKAGKVEVEVVVEAAGALGPSGQ